MSLVKVRRRGNEEIARQREVRNERVWGCEINKVRRVMNREQEETK